MNGNDNWRVFWRITFDVINGVARLQQEMTLWTEQGDRIRLGRRVKDLIPVKHGIVHYINDRAIFVGGHLECTIDLTADATALLMAVFGSAPEQESVLEGITSAIDGENISAIADLVTYDVQGVDEYPIFSFPQPQNGVSLSEHVDRTVHVGRTIDWQISPPAVGQLAPFALDDFYGQHRVRVRQEMEGGGQIFKHLIDSISLGTTSTGSTYEFLTTPFSFYIGRTPSQAGLYGEISHLEFDPHDSCGNCPHRPSKD